jgi:hypothetical protein
MRRLRRRAGLAAAALAVSAAAAGCFGPQRMSRRMDDWSNQAYVDNPWLMGNSVSYTLLATVFAGTRFIDGVVNFFYFWLRDAWPLGSGSGTPFEHTPVVPPRK